ncbi:MAG TPA: hypothetical protein VFZ65_00465, partial [Planctomycetota bacterium]|nr:hypothetical protein [Planctomycetota bacterium]
RRAQGRQRKFVPLQKKAFEAWRGEKPRHEESPDGAHEADDTWYADEVCRIASDYAAGLRTQRGA